VHEIYGHKQFHYIKSFGLRRHPSPPLSDIVLVYFFAVICSALVYVHLIFCTLLFTSLPSPTPLSSSTSRCLHLRPRVSAIVSPQSSSTLLPLYTPITYMRPCLVYIVVYTKPSNSPCLLRHCPRPLLRRLIYTALVYLHLIVLTLSSTLLPIAADYPTIVVYVLPSCLLRIIRQHSNRCLLYQAIAPLTKIDTWG